jgi:hypothetical protein
MKFFIDCEWNDFRGALISMALISEEGDQWYEVLGCRSPSPWVAEHVMPHLPPNSKWVTLEQLQMSLVEFLRRYREIEIVADWPEDIERFCSVLITGPGDMLPIGPTIKLVVNRRLGSSESRIPHQALEDAKGLRAKYLELLR